MLPIMWKHCSAVVVLCVLACSAELGKVHLLQIEYCHGSLLNLCDQCSGL